MKSTKNYSLKFLRKQVVLINKKFEDLSVKDNQDTLLQFTFEQLDDAKRDLLKYGKLVIVAAEVNQGVTSNG